MTDHIEATETRLSKASGRPAPESIWGRLRTAWINNSPKLYARLIPGKMPMVNQLVTLRLEEFQSILSALDRQDSELAHQVAELSALVVQLSQRITELEGQLTDLAQETSGEPTKDPDGN